MPWTSRSILVSSEPHFSFSRRRLCAASLALDSWEPKTDPTTASNTSGAIMGFFRRIYDWLLSLFWYAIRFFSMSRCEELFASRCDRALMTPPTLLTDCYIPTTLVVFDDDHARRQ